MNNKPFLFAGNSNPVLFKKIAEEVAKLSGIPDLTLGDATVGRFSDGEIKIKINESLSGRDVYILQSTCYPFAENFMDLCLMVDATRRSDPEKIRVIIPYFGGARQDKRKDREPMTARVCADFIQHVGADSVFILDPHSEQLQGFFHIPVHIISVRKPFQDYFISKGLEKFYTISPDATGTERARLFAERFHTPVGFVDKRRTEPNKAESLALVGDVAGWPVAVLDDIIDTGGSLRGTENLLLSRLCEEIRSLFYHGVLSGQALEIIQNSKIKEFIFSDSIPLKQEFLETGKVTQVSCAPVCAEAIYRDMKKNSIREMMKI